MNTHSRPFSRAFTIVELLVVVVVIAILATIVVVSYNGISNQAKESSLKSDLKTASKQIEILKLDNGSYPADASGIKKNQEITFDYATVGGKYCLQGTMAGYSKTFYITNDGAIIEGTCPAMIGDGIAMQFINSTNCPAARTRAVDTRDNRTYWIQKIGSTCWMLTNLAYAGVGTNTHNDVKTIALGSWANTYTAAQYYNVNVSPFTIEPNNPSSATDGSGQYGYFYNWCAAMGAQLSTAACSTTPSTPIPASDLPDVNVSICPAGWRLPSGSTGGEFAALNTAANSGATNSDAGLLTNWLGRRAGSMSGSIVSNQGTQGNYWSSTISNPSFYTTGRNAAYFRFYSTSVQSSGLSIATSTSMPVRCVAM